MKRDIIASIVLISICILFWNQTKEFSKFGALFPRTIIVILGFLSSLLFINSLIKILKKSRHEEKIERLQDIKSVVVSIIVMILWLIFINILGFLTSSIIFFILMYFILVKRGIKLKKIILNVVSILITIFIFYYFFSKLLQVPFPTGILI